MVRRRCDSLLDINLDVFFSSRRGGVLRLLGTVPGTKAGSHLRGRGPRRPLQRVNNRCELLPGAELRVGNPVLFVGYHKPAAVQPHVAQVQNCV